MRATFIFSPYSNSVCRVFVVKEDFENSTGRCDADDWMFKISTTGVDDYINGKSKGANIL